MDMMKMLLSKVREEMEDACEYATTAEMIKAESPNTAKVLMSLSEQERSHATMLIQEAKSLGRTGEDKALCYYEMEVMQAKTIISSTNGIKSKRLNNHIGVPVWALFFIWGDFGHKKL